VLSCLRLLYPFAQAPRRLGAAFYANAAGAEGDGAPAVAPKGPAKRGLVFVKSGDAAEKLVAELTKMTRGGLRCAAVYIYI